MKEEMPPVILVVDDDACILKLLETFLRKDNKYDVIPAKSAESCLTILEKNKTIKLVLLDISMGGMDGIDALKSIKSNYPFIEVIMMTAYGTIEKAVSAMKLGAADFVQKPFNIEHLLITISNCLRKVNSDKLIAMSIGKVFINYVRENFEQVVTLYDKLKYAGFNPWMDKKNILPGEVWETVIEKAITDSDFFLVCLSNDYVNKRGLAQKEIKIAIEKSIKMLDNDIFIIPVRFDECFVPGSLRNLQWVDFFENDGWNRLLDALRIGLQRRLNKKTQI